ncbi:MAG: hypothetical protein JNK40_03550 [Chromatiales bacterium]|nr:hypothetical protein [Chromatiales bacterium]
MKNVGGALWLFLGVLIQADAATYSVDRQPMLDPAFGFCGMVSTCDPANYGAENFTVPVFPVAPLLQNISFYALVETSQDPDFHPSDLSGISWLLMRDSGGHPGSVVAGAENAPYSYTYFGEGLRPNGLGTYSIYRYDIDVPDMSLNAATYWVAFRLLDTDTQRSFYWARHSCCSGGSNFVGTPATGWTSPVYLPNFDEFAFGINVVPVPSAAFLFPSALALLGLAKRSASR